jgi:general secretion pathway protein H
MRSMNQRGVTLIELIIVFVIIAIGATLTAPGINSWMPYYRLRSATRDIVSAMRLAQMKAVSNNLTYRISFDPPNNSFIIQYQTTAGAWVDDGGTQTLPSGVVFITNFGNIATFSPNSSATSGNIILNNIKGMTKTIQLLGTTGRIRVG